MNAFQPEDVRAMLTAAGMQVEDWDAAELAGMLNAQRAEIDAMREQLAQKDEPALRFDPRWE